MDDYLLGTAEFCQLVRIPVKSIQWFRSTGKYDFPPTEVAVDKRGTWICRASTALGWARDWRGYTGPVPDPMPLPDLVSTGYIVEHTARKRKTIQSWALRGELPPTYAVVSHGPGKCPLWERSTVHEWWAQREGVAA